MQPTIAQLPSQRLLSFTRTSIACVCSSKSREVEESIAGSESISGSEVDMPSVSPVCFGQILKQLDASASLLQPCEPSFVQGNKRLTDKFCTRCRSGFYIPYSHVRALPPAKAEMVRPTIAQLPTQPHLSFTHTWIACVCSSESLERAFGKPRRRVRPRATGTAGSTP